MDIKIILSIIFGYNVQNYRGIENNVLVVYSFNIDFGHETCYRFLPLASVPWKSGNIKPLTVNLYSHLLVTDYLDDFSVNIKRYA